MKRDTFSYLILLIFVLLFGLRLVHITADPPIDLSWSGGLFFDEGALAHNARNKVLFGEWEMDDWNDFYYSPILTYIKWGIFSLFGVGLTQVRLVPVVFSWLTLGMLYLALRITLTRSASILGVVLLGFNYIFLMYNRIGLTETPFVFFAVLTLYFWQRGLHKDSFRHAGWYMFFSGVSCFTVHIFKTIFYFLPVPLTALILFWLISGNSTKRKRLLGLSGCFLAGMVITAAIWLVVFYYPNYDVIHQAGTYVKALSIPYSLKNFLENVMRTPFFSLFLQTPVILILSLGYLLYLIYLLFHHRGNVQSLDIFVSLWFLAHFFFFIGYSYRPTRYYVPIIPPMAVLATLGTLRMVQVKEIKFLWRFLQGLSLVLLLISLGMNSLWYYRWASSPRYVVRDTSRELGTMLEDAFIAGLETPTLCLENTHRALYVWENFTNYNDTLERFKLTHLFLAEFNDAIGYYRRKFPELMKRAILLKTYWIKGSRFHLYSVVEPFINDITVTKERYSSDEPVTLMLNVKNNDHRKARAVEVGWLLHPHSEKDPAIIATKPVNLEALEEKTVTFSKQLPPGSYDVMTGIFLARRDVYEAESMSTQIGQNRSDPEASKEHVRYAAVGSQGFLIYGPYQHYPAGKFDTEFRLKYSGELRTEEDEIARIDIAADSGNTIVARMVVRPPDFENIDTYQTFRLSYFLKSPEKLEFRVFSPGNVELWVDAIMTSFVRGEWYEKTIIVEAF